MVDLHQFSEWLVVACAFVLLPLLLTRHPWRGRAAEERLQRVGAWALRQIRLEEPSDHVADEVAASLRREQLRRDLDRLHRLTLTDMSMSATRQLANRLAYDELRHQLETTSPAGLTSTVSTAYIPTRAASPDLVDVGRSRDRHREWGVETIEISWRSRSLGRKRGPKV